jgi:DNA-binding beta-propeller fold protein YncE
MSRSTCNNIRRPAAALLGLALVAIFALAPAQAAMIGPENPSGYEVWALDQGTNMVYVYSADHELVDEIDLGQYGVQTPHMIAFNSTHEYAVIASTRSGDVTVIRTEDRYVVDIIETGPRTHMASFTPDDSAIIVDVIGSPNEERDGEIIEITADLENERFSSGLGRSLVIAEDPLFQANQDRFGDSGPICHEYGPGGTHAFITLGPSVDHGGLVVLNTETFELDHVFGTEELPVNCGTVPTADRAHMLVTAGSGELGHYYVLDTETMDVVFDGDSHGVDAHGAWLTPDGSEFWLVNRVSDNGIVIDAETFEVTDQFDDLGGTPDIMAASPFGHFFYVSLRGPNPQSAAHVAEGDTPGFSVISTVDGSLVDVVQPDAGNADSDFHGLGVRYIP